MTNTQKYFQRYADARRNGTAAQLKASRGAWQAFAAWEKNPAQPILESEIEDLNQALAFTYTLHEAGVTSFILGKTTGLMETIHLLIQAGCFFEGGATYTDNLNEEQKGLEYSI